MRSLFIPITIATALSCSACKPDYVAGAAATSGIEGSVSLSGGSSTFPAGSAIATITNTGSSTFCVRSDPRALGNRLRVFKQNGEELFVDLRQSDLPWYSRAANTFSCVPAGDAYTAQHTPIRAGTDFLAPPPGTYVYQFEVLAFPVERLAKADPGQPLGFSDPRRAGRKSDGPGGRVLSTRQTIVVPE